MDFKKIFKLSNHVYDILTYIVLAFFPGIVFFWQNLYVIWNIPYGEQIASTLTAIETVLGIWLLVSKKNYEKENRK